MEGKRKSDPADNKNQHGQVKLIHQVPADK
jgi:hypothetical protein